jgi:hypothetical protein
MSSGFTDCRGRRWTVVITHGQQKRVKRELDIDLYALADKQLAGLKDLLGDPEKFVSAIFCLLQRDADELGVSPESFADGLDGPTMEAMGDAFLQGLADFFPNPQARKAMREMISKGKQAMDLLATKIDQALEKITPQSILKDLESQHATSCEPSTSSPAS